MDWFFFSSRRRHTRYWRDWSSDVCSSDLGVRVRCNPHPGVFGLAPSAELRRRITEREAELAERGGFALPPHPADAGPEGDWKSVAEGKSVDLGGRRIIKKKKIHQSVSSNH